VTYERFEQVERTLLYVRIGAACAIVAVLVAMRLEGLL
jgi:hypothetical protein